MDGLSLGEKDCVDGPDEDDSVWVKGTAWTDPMEMTVSVGERTAWTDPMEMTVSVGERDCVDRSDGDDCKCG